MKNLPGITLVGLGPGDHHLITRQVWELITTVPEIYLRTAKHPVVSHFPNTLQIHSFDHIYDQADSFEQVYQQIVEQIITLGQRPEGVIYAVPGHPFIAENTAPKIYALAKEKNIPVRIYAGISFVEVVFSALGLDPFPHTTLVDAFDLAGSYFPKFSPGAGVLITQLHARAIAAEIKLNLILLYPEDHLVKLVHAAGTEDEHVEEIPLYQIDRSPHINLLTSLYLPPIAGHTSLAALQDIIARLRAPDGCPWDRKQTYQSLRPYLMEEAFEALAAIDADDPAAIAEELGDLLLQIFLHTQIAAEQGDFTITDVASGISEKLIRRHPHIFGDVIVSGADEVASNWEKIKEQENIDQDKPTGLLDSIPVALPALAQSNKIQQRAARIGFDWPDTQGVFEKIQEELRELVQAERPEDVSAELGDLLLIIVRLADKLGVEPEIALREANNRFRERFSLMEEFAADEATSLADMQLEQLDDLWKKAKAFLQG